MPAPKPNLFEPDDSRVNVAKLREAGREDSDAHKPPSALEPARDAVEENSNPDSNKPPK